MKNFTVSLNIADRDFDINVNCVSRSFTIRPGVGPPGPAGATGPAGPQGPAGPNEITSSTASDGTADLSIHTLRVDAEGDDAIVATCDNLDAISGTSQSGNGVVGSSDDGVGVFGGSASSIGVLADSTNGIALKAQTVTGTAIVASAVNGTYAAEFQSEATTQSAIERVRGWFVWFFGAFTGRLKTADITANREWTLPDASGTIALTSNIPTLGTNVATFLATPTSANLAAAVSDETGSGSLVFATSPTLTTPNIAQINGGTAANDDLTLQGTTNATRTTSYVIIQPNGGNVGVNTSTPSHALQVFGTSGRVAVMGDVGTSTGTTTPVNVSFGSTFGTNTPGTVGNLKWDLFTSSSSGSRYGIGMSAGLMEFQAGPSGGHGFYVNQGTLALFVSSTAEVGIGTATPSSRAILDLTSTTKGFLPPRMTTAQRDAIVSPPAGLMIYNTSTNKLNFYTGSTWEVITSS